jgi:hypothetical protein
MPGYLLNVIFNYCINTPDNVKKVEKSFPDIKMACFNVIILIKLYHNCKTFLTKTFQNKQNN